MFKSGRFNIGQVRHRFRTTKALFEAGFEIFGSHTSQIFGSFYVILETVFGFFNSNDAKSNPILRHWPSTSCPTLSRLSRSRSSYPKMTFLSRQKPQPPKPARKNTNMRIISPSVDDWLPSNTFNTLHCFAAKSKRVRNFNFGFL